MVVREAVEAERAAQATAGDEVENAVQAQLDDSLGSGSDAVNDDGAESDLVPLRQLVEQLRTDVERLEQEEAMDEWET